MKAFLLTFFFLISSNSFAQPFVLECDLDVKYVRNYEVEQQNTGVWCKSCRIAITVEEKNTLYIDGVSPPFGILYDTKGKKDLDSNGWGRIGTWSISSNAIEAKNQKIEYGKEAGWISVTINRLTGEFRGYYRTKNPIGDGNFEIFNRGQCKAAKPAF